MPRRRPLHRARARSSGSTPRHLGASTRSRCPKSLSGTGSTPWNCDSPQPPARRRWIYLEGSIQHSPYVRLPTCETGSLETAPSATQSPRCSHSGIARGQLRVFLRVSGDCSGSREGAEEDEARPRQSGGQCAEDRLANRVSWSGFRGIRRQRRTTVRAAQPRAVDRKSLRLRESASQVSRSYPGLSRVQNS